MLDNLGTTLLYVFLALFYSFAIKVYAININSEKKYYQRQGEVFLSISVLLMIFVATFRDATVGTDAMPYVERFLDANLNSYFINWREVITLKVGEPLFFVFNSVMRTLTDNYHVYFFVVYSFIAVAFVTFLSKAYREYVSVQIDRQTIFFLPVIFAVNYFLHSWNVMRNYLAIAVVLFAFVSIIQEKKWQSLILILVATLFHYTAACFFVVWLMFFLDKNDKILSSKMLNFSIAFGGFLLIYETSSVIAQYFLSTKYQSYVEMVSSWTSFMPGLIIAIGAIIFSETLQKHGPIAKACIKLQPIKVILMGLGFLGGSRVGYFFSIQDIYVISLLYSLCPMKFQSPISRFVFRTSVFVFVFVVFINNMRHLAESSGVFPYVFANFDLM